MAKCRGCGRYFKTRGGLKSHLSMVRRTGSHYPRKRRSNRRSYRARRTYRRRSYRRRRY